ncbi:MAG TPA: endolytic transglycosylase MltG [Bacteroidales bacterium]|nr:endolytic transglycosylase MltG [Bacteroidales bacterium]
MKLSKKKVGGGIGALFVFGIIAVYLLFFIPNGEEQFGKLNISENSSYETIMQNIKENGHVKNFFTFKIAAQILDFKGNIKKGKYTFLDNDNNFQIIRKLRRGQHFPVRFTFNNIRTKEQLAKKLDGKFLFEREELENLLDNNTFLSTFGLTPETAISIFIPNTYELYYDINAVQFFNSMFKQYKRFWNKKREKQAQTIGLTKTEVIILASIVEEENFKEQEKGLIAGLYINRLQKGMRLQADPTVKFALQDFNIKRITHNDLAVNSPYNTYLYTGLPPGPIRIPETSTIDSVLNYRRHDYLYMCAKEDFSGFHYFSKTYNEHLKNAAKYHKALNGR